MTRSKPFVTSTKHIPPFGKPSAPDLERLCLWLVEREGCERAEYLAEMIRETGDKAMG